jgi:hypothetical protein
MAVCLSRGEFKGEERVNQFDEEMATAEQETEPTSIGLEDATSHFSLC